MSTDGITLTSEHVPQNTIASASIEDVETTFRKQRIRLLRAFADFLEQHPTADTYLHGGEVLDYCENADAMAAKAREIGGMWSKRTTDYYFYLDREVVPGVVYKLYSSREVVCEAVVVGQEAKEVPDPDYIAAAPKVTKMVDKIEWRCPDSLLAMTAMPEGEADAA